MKNILCGVAALALTVLAACASSDDSSATGDPVASVASAIVNGVDDTTAHDSVVLVLYEPQGKLVSSCTGTLVAPNLVLTARHCVSETDESLICKADGTAYEGGKISADDAPSSFYIYPGLNAIRDVTGSAKAAARGKVVVTETTSVLCNHDVAFIVLDTDIDYPTAPLRTTSGAVVNESLTAVGWGLTESGKLPSTRQSRDGVKVVVSGSYVQDKETGIGIGDSEFAVREAICAGDSGGPAFSTKGAVVGVVSRGGNGTDPTTTTNQASSCIGADTVNVYTDLAKKSALVTKAFAAAGYAPREEGTAPGIANGETCTVDADCNSLECVASVCVTRCDDSTAAACGDGQTCSDKDSVKVCLTPSQITALAASTSASAAASSKSTSDGGGCAAAPRTTGGSFGGGLLVGLSLLMLRRRSGGRARGDR